jgi:hypothetical protein
MPYDINTSYQDLFHYLSETMKPGTMIALDKLTGNPINLIQRIKNLINYNLIPYIKFDTDYKILMKSVGYMIEGKYILLNEKNNLTSYIVGDMINDITIMPSMAKIPVNKPPTCDNPGLLF